MKRLLQSGFLACIMLLLLLGTQSAKAQCTSPTSYQGATANNFNTPQTLTTCAFAGEYSPYSGVTSGNTYSFTATGGTGNFITVRQTNGTGTVVASGISPLTGIVSPISGVLAVIVHVDGSCTTDSNCHTLIATCTSCPAPPVFAPINITSIPVTNQSLVCNTANDYNSTNVPAVCGSATNAYKGGNEAVYTFTPTTTGSYDISISGQTWTSIFVYAGNPTSGGTCVNSIGTSTSSKSMTVTLTAGTEYYIWFDTNPTPNSPCPGTFSLVATPPPPVNDDCGAAIALTVNANLDCGVSTAGTTLSATQSTETAPSCSASGVNDDVWYTFVAQSTAHQVRITGATNASAAAVYTGSCGSLTQIVGACATTSSGTANVNLTGLTVGTTYRVRVYTTSAVVGTVADFTICVGTPPPPPTNDECTGAIALTVNANLDCGVSTAGTTISATQSTETAPSCSATGVNDDVWYTFIAQNTAHQVRITGATNTTAAAVYSGACGSLTQIVSGCTSTVSGTLNLNLTGLSIGTTYRVRVYTTSSVVGTVADFTICVGTPPPPPPNDDCAAAILISGCQSIAGYTISGTGDGLTVTCGTSVSSTLQGVWYRFVGDGNPVEVNTCDPATDFDTKIHVYSGACGTLTCVGGNDDSSPADPACNLAPGGLNRKSKFNWISVPGVTYYVYVYPFTNPGGNFVLNLISGPPCAAPAPAASNVSSTSATISWAATAGAVSYSYSFGTGSHVCGTGAVAQAGTSVNLSNLIPNTSYTVCVRSNCSCGSSTYTSVTFTTAPLPNDLCAGAIPLVCNSTVAGSTVGATSDSGAGSCGPASSPGIGVWYSLAGDGSQITLNLCGSAYDTKVHVYSGSCAGLVCVASNDDSGVCGNNRSHLIFNTSPATTYYIVVSGFGSATGAFSMNVGCVCGAPLSFPWSNNAVGAATGEGIDNVCGGSIDISSNGYSQSSASDALFFSNQTLCGNQSITVKVQSITNGGFAGIMFRDTTSAGSRFVAIKTQLNQFVHREIRTVANGAKQTQQLPAFGHTWLRLTRVGNTFSGATSHNGIHWNQAFTVTLPLNSCLRVGLFTQGLNPTSTAQAQFSMVTGFPDNQIGLNLPSSYNTIESVQGLTIFPNPASSELNLKIGTEFLGKDITINVMDQIGRVVLSRNINELQTQQEQINVSTLPGGMYILSLVAEGHAAQVQKFIVSGNRP